MNIHISQLSSLYTLIEIENSESRQLLSNRKVDMVSI